MYGSVAITLSIKPTIFEIFSKMLRAEISKKRKITRKKKQLWPEIIDQYADLNTQWIRDKWSSLHRSVTKSFVVFSENLEQRWKVFLSSLISFDQSIMQPKPTAIRTKINLFFHQKKGFLLRNSISLIYLLNAEAVFEGDRMEWYEQVINCSDAQQFAKPILKESLPG